MDVKDVMKMLAHDDTNTCHVLQVPKSLQESIRYVLDMSPMKIDEIWEHDEKTRKHFRERWIQCQISFGDTGGPIDFFLSLDPNNARKVCEYFLVKHVCYTSDRIEKIGGENG